jgi:hypothetical protein
MIKSFNLFQKDTMLILGEFLGNPSLIIIHYCYKNAVPIDTNFETYYLRTNLCQSAISNYFVGCSEEDSIVSQNYAIAYPYVSN